MPAFDLVNTAIVIVALIAGVLGVCAYLTLAERKVSAWMQDRLGPNRVGPGGLLQPLADGGKFFLKEEVIPTHVDRIFYLLAPAVAVGTALLALAIVPFGSTAPPPDPVHATAAGDPAAVAAFEQQQKEYREQFNFVIAPGLDIGVLYVFAIGSLAVYGVILGGWSANNKYSLLGALRVQRPDHQLRDPARHVGPRRVPDRRLAEPREDHRLADAERAVLAHLVPAAGVPAVHDQPLRRVQPPAVRPAGSRAGTRRRLPHRVLEP